MSSYVIPDPPPIPEEQTDLSSIGYPNNAITAFLVFQDKDGRWQGLSTLLDGALPDLRGLQVEREASMIDMVHGAQAVLTDGNNNLLIGLTSNTVIAMMRSQAEAAQKHLLTAKQNEQVLQNLKGASGRRR